MNKEQSLLMIYGVITIFIFCSLYGLLMFYINKRKKHYQQLQLIQKIIYEQGNSAALLPQTILFITIQVVVIGMILQSHTLNIYVFTLYLSLIVFNIYSLVSKKMYHFLSFWQLILLVYFIFLGILTYVGMFLFPLLTVIICVVSIFIQLYLVKKVFVTTNKI